MDTIIINLMLNFLRNSFPVVKIKNGKRFKRGVNLDGVKYFLPVDAVALRSILFRSLKGYYDADDKEINAVITQFYKLK